MAGRAHDGNATFSPGFSETVTSQGLAPDVRTAGGHNRCVTPRSADQQSLQDAQRTKRTIAPLRRESGEEFHRVVTRTCEQQLRGVRETAVDGGVPRLRVNTVGADGLREAGQSL